MGLLGRLTIMNDTGKIYSISYYIYNTSHILKVTKRLSTTLSSNAEGIMGDYLHHTFHIPALKTMNTQHCSQQRKPLRRGRGMDATCWRSGAQHLRSAGFSNALVLEHSRTRTPTCGLSVALAPGTVADG